MSLFLTSYLPSSPSSALSFQNTSLDYLDQPGSTGQNHQPLIRFLEIAAALDVDILPLTWEPAFEQLGNAGAVGTVSQNVLNSSVAFAFKRFRPDSTDRHRSEAEYRHLQYQAMARELVVLTCPAIRYHPNIAVFVGICFELAPEHGEVWPVLVTIKSNTGDLQSAVVRNDSVVRANALGICREIAKAIRILHQCGVVHGDIKPNNVLIAEDADQDAMQITLTDFGFSEFTATDEESVSVTRTEPWEAPEWSHKRFKMSHAQKTDIYSFGLVCLWLFFKDEPLSIWGLSESTLDSAFVDPSCAAFVEFQRRKRSDESVLEMATDFVRRSHGLDSNTKAVLGVIFGMTLARHVGDRVSGMDEIISLAFGEDEKLAPEYLPRRLREPNCHGSLQIETLFYDLESCDFRVHKAIAQALQELGNGVGCKPCIENAAFQLALCHKIGFGVPSDETKCKEWLTRSGKAAADLADSIERIKGKTGHSDVVHSLARLGYRHDHASRYQTDGILTRAIIYYRDTISTREQVFGPSNYSVLRLQGILLALLRWNDEAEEALKIVAHLNTMISGSAKSDQMVVKTGLVRVLVDLGLTNEAAAIGQDVLDTYATEPESRHSDRLDHEQEMIMLLIRGHEYDGATELAERNLEECSRDLGSLHSSTRGAQRCLAACFNASGQLQRAVTVNLALIAASEVFKKGSVQYSKLIEDVSRLGVQYYRLGKLEDAQHCYAKVMGLIGDEKSLATHAVNVVNNEAVDLIQKKDFELSHIILEALLLETRQHLGESSRETALVMGNLSHVYSDLRRWNEAETLERRVVQIRSRVLGISHQDTITALGNLRATLLAQGKLAEAFECAQEELTTVQNRAASTSNERIAAMNTVANAFEEASAYAEAASFFEREIELRKEQDVVPCPGLLLSMAHAVVCHMHVDGAEELRRARVLMIKLLLGLTEPFQEHVDDLVLGLLGLALLCWDSEHITEATQISAGLKLLLQSGLPVSGTVQDEFDSVTAQQMHKRGLMSLNVTFNPALILQLEESDAKEMRVALS